MERVAIVTGGASGIGRATVALLAATPTGMTAGIAAADRGACARRNIPVGRDGRAEEVAHMIVALTAAEASFVNGAVITVDGGMTAPAR